jgi:hypothetical protein
MGRPRKQDVPVRAASIDDAIRAAIIRDCISRVGCHATGPENLAQNDKPREPEPTAKRQKLDAAATAAYAAEMTQPVQLPACSTIVSQAAFEDRSACVLPWPVDDFAAQLQSSTLEEFALSPLETELVFLREALTLSTKREESLTKMTKTLRIELHKAYRLIALQQLNNFTCDTEMPIFPGTQH